MQQSQGAGCGHAAAGALGRVEDDVVGLPLLGLARSSSPAAEIGRRARRRNHPHRSDSDRSREPESRSGLEYRRHYCRAPGRAAGACRVWRTRRESEHCRFLPGMISPLPGYRQSRLFGPATLRGCRFRGPIAKCFSRRKDDRVRRWAANGFGRPTTFGCGSVRFWAQHRNATRQGAEEKDRFAHRLIV